MINSGIYPSKSYNIWQDDFNISSEQALCSKVWAKNFYWDHLNGYDLHCGKIKEQEI